MLTKREQMLIGFVLALLIIGGIIQQVRDSGVENSREILQTQSNPY